VDGDILTRMKEFEKAVLDLDESIRGAAFTMMEGYILGGVTPQQPRQAGLVEPGRPQSDHEPGNEAVEAFFAKGEITKPADAVYAIAGYLFSQYGSAPFTIDDVRELAQQVGLTLPDRPDNTLRNAKKNKKSLFRLKGDGWVTTASGELVLKEKFDIKKGRKKRPVPDDGNGS
jgi:hypothetical protein